MMHLNLGAGKNGPLQILCLGCHSDDIEIGCGGAVLQLAEQYPDCEFHWVVFSAHGPRRAEAEQGSELFVGTRLKNRMLKEFPDAFMPFVGAEVKKFFEELKRSVSPDLIFTHSRRDAHQDHRLIAELTWNSFRNHFILEYEIPKYDGDMGQPSVFVPLRTEQYEKKIRFLMEAFKTQQGKGWFEPETFLALMRLRGMECNAESGYAEAFYCRKIII
jgi:LmbE family N-acetylglucosaminyl deacetylase